MKVLLAGSDKGYAIEHFYVNYLRQLGVHIELFPANRIFQDYYHQSLLNKILCRLGISPIYKQINKMLLDVVESFEPDILWVFKGMELYPSVLKQVKQKGIKLVNYNPDHPFVFTGRGSGNKYVAQAVALYDLYFTYSSDIKKEIGLRSTVKTQLLPFGYDLEEGVIQKSRNQDEVVKLCFIGNPDQQRASFLLKLADRGVKMDLYGHGWKRFVQHRNIDSYDALYNEALWNCIRRYRIQLNLMRVHNETSHNMRTFEVPAIGGILLAPDTFDHRSFFDNGREIFLYSGIEECYQQIQHLLSLSREQADAIRIAAIEKSQQAGYSYLNRAGFVKQCFENLLKLTEQ